PARGVVAVFLTDAPTLRGRRLDDLRAWRRELARTSHVRACFQGAAFRAPLRLRAVRSSLLEPVAGPGWLAAGDAAASFDPLSSIGVGQALASGAAAARAAHAWLSGNEGPLRDYADAARENFARYLASRRAYYMQERRWADRPFWAARTATREAW